MSIVYILYTRGVLATQYNCDEHIYITGLWWEHMGCGPSEFGMKTYIVKDIELEIIWMYQEYYKLVIHFSFYQGTC